MYWDLAIPRWHALLREKARREPLAMQYADFEESSADWQLRRIEYMMVNAGRIFRSCGVSGVSRKLAKHAKSRARLNLPNIRLAVHHPTPLLHSLTIKLRTLGPSQHYPE